MASNSAHKNIQSAEIYDELDYAMWARRLESNPDYRVLRRFRFDAKFQIAPPQHPVKIGLFVDVETTGVDTNRDKIIEFGAIKFTFDDQGNIFDILEQFSSLEDPGIPIPKEASEVNGIFDKDVTGKIIDNRKIVELLENVALIISHHAAFDRQMIERRFNGFDNLSWVCSWKEVSWEKKFNTIGAKLGNILASCGQFHDAHRALVDCQIGIYVLANAKSEEGRSAFSYLLESSKKTTYLIPATDAPFEKKDMLKSRGYKWAPDPKVWYTAVEASNIQSELEWLENSVGLKNLPRDGFREINATDRYSIRSENNSRNFIHPPRYLSAEQVSKIELIISPSDKTDLLKVYNVKSINQIDPKCFDHIMKILSDKYFK